MAGKTPSEFRFDADDQEPESYYHEEFKDLRIEKLSQRVTLLTILLPCLMAVAIYFGYQNLAGRVSQSRANSAREIQQLTQGLEDLSKNFNDKLITFSTTLSTQDKDFGTSIEGRLFALNKDIGKLQQNFNALNEDLKRTIKQNQDTIEKLKASKADKKSQAVAVEKIKASIKPLKKELQQLPAIRKEIKSVSAATEKLQSKLSDELGTLTAAVQQQGRDYDELQTSVTQLSKKAIEREVDLLAAKNQAKAITDINQRLDTLQSRIDGILKISAAQKQSLKRVTQKAVTPQSGAAPGSETGSAALGTPPKTITEKDLIE